MNLHDTVDVNVESSKLDKTVCEVMDLNSASAEAFCGGDVEINELVGDTARTSPNNSTGSQMSWCVRQFWPLDK